MTVGSWVYGKEQFSYGDDDQSYRKAAEFLDDAPLLEVEDWGCGTAYAKRFFRCRYVGVDQAPGFADRIADLRYYDTEAHGILLRHVLEHNVEWPRILRNALKSADKLALVIFTPFAETTRQIAWNPGYNVPDISFRREDLTDHFNSYKSETFSSSTQYGTETIFYVVTHD